MELPGSRGDQKTGRYDDVSAACRRREGSAWNTRKSGNECAPASPMLERERDRAGENPGLWIMRDSGTYAAPRDVVQQRPLPAAIPQIMENPSALVVRHSKRHDACDAQELQKFDLHAIFFSNLVGDVRTDRVFRTDKNIPRLTHMAPLIV